MTIRNQISEFLNKWNVDVVSVDSLAQAEARIAKDDVAVIIQDLFLGGPAADVYDFIQKHCGPDTAREAIVITGHIAKADLRRVVDAGAYCFFKKPVDLDQLLIATWAAQQRAERRQRQ
jgi:DNA-binding NtrC family response regulator